MISNEAINAVRQGEEVTLLVPTLPQTNLKQQLLDAREQLQCDLQTQLEGLVKDHVVDSVCQAVVDRFKPLLEVEIE